jgi:hypothetical protein
VKAAAAGVRLQLALAGAADSDDAVLRAVAALRPALGAAKDPKYPYFGWMTRMLAASIPARGARAGTDAQASTDCFASITMSTSITDGSVLHYDLKASGKKDAHCSSFIAVETFGQGGKSVVLDTDEAGLKWSANLTTDADKRWYTETKGVKLYLHRGGFVATLLDMVDTVVLMAGFGEFPITKKTMAANVKFMNEYVQYSARMQPLSVPRAAGSAVANTMNLSWVNSGDSLIIVRYDGLDGMIGWGEGYSAGHSTTVIREPVCAANGGGDECLFIYESTAKDAYWPVNGIQKTPIRAWLARAETAQMNVLLAPISADAARAFNTTAAMAFFAETEGLNYGYLNFLWGWIDTPNKNFPTVPPTFTYGLNEDNVEQIFLLIDESTAATPRSNIIGQAMNKRIGTANLTMPGVMRYAFEKLGIKRFGDIYSMPEQDSWRYATLRDGKPVQGRAMVCCAFTCHMWKHGGLFKAIGDEINCGEQTLWDIYSMKIFDDAKLGAGRPEVCKTADPSNQLCQLLGDVTLHPKPDFNTRPLYKHMGEKCSSQLPDYIRQPGC